MVLTLRVHGYHMHTCWTRRFTAQLHIPTPPRYLPFCGVPLYTRLFAHRHAQPVLTRRWCCGLPPPPTTAAPLVLDPVLPVPTAPPPTPQPACPIPLPAPLRFYHLVPIPRHRGTALPRPPRYTWYACLCCLTYHLPPCLTTPRLLPHAAPLRAPTGFLPAHYVYPARCCTPLPPTYLHLPPGYTLFTRHTRTYLPTLPTFTTAATLRTPAVLAYAYHLTAVTAQRTLPADSTAHLLPTLLLHFARPCGCILPLHLFWTFGLFPFPPLPVCFAFAAAGAQHALLPRTLHGTHAHHTTARTPAWLGRATCNTPNCTFATPHTASLCTLHAAPDHPPPPRLPPGFTAACGCHHPAQHLLPRLGYLTVPGCIPV